MPLAKNPKPLFVKPVQSLGILRKSKSILLFTGINPESDSYHLIEARQDQLQGEHARFAKSDCAVHRSRRERCSVHEWVVDVTTFDVKALELALKRPLEDADPEAGPKAKRHAHERDNRIFSPPPFFFSFPFLFAIGLTFQKLVQTIGRTPGFVKKNSKSQCLVLLSTRPRLSPNYSMVCHSYVPFPRRWANVSEISANDVQSGVGVREKEFEIANPRPVFPAAPVVPQLLNGTSFLCSCFLPLG